MYCPKCATQNNEGTRFCRSCGANLSLVPQALTGQLDGTRSRRRHGQSSEGPISLTSGITKVFMGAGFLLVALLLWITRQWWGLFLLIPGFFMLGRGVAEIVGSKQIQQSPYGERQPFNPYPANTDEIQSPATAKFGPPPSVTETTTRHLDNSDVTGKETS